MLKIKTAIIGASGYTGVELIRILSNHPNVEICELIANSNADQEIKNIYQHLSIYKLPKLKNIDQINFKDIDLIFSCLPHNTSQIIFKKILDNPNNNHLKIIDLSADFRLSNPSDYNYWYNHDHQAEDLQNQAVYGLSEINKNKIKSAKIIACPGCYPTSILLPLIPLIKDKLIDVNDIIVDSKSGSSGAGRALKNQNLFCEVNNSVKAYNIGKHRHLGEIQQELTIANDHNKVILEFTPHLIPVNRGIISTIYVKNSNNFSIEQIKNLLTNFYKNDYFVNIVDHEISISNIIGTNHCLINVNQGNNSQRIIITSVIDNLCKGASGQAVQNMNIIFNLDEKTGLDFTPLFP